MKLRKLSIILAWVAIFIAIMTYIGFNATWIFPRIWLSMKVLVGNFIFFWTNIKFPQVYDLINLATPTVPGTDPIIIPESTITFMERLSAMFTLLFNKSYYAYVIRSLGSIMKWILPLLQVLPLVALALYLIKRKYLSKSGKPVGYVSKPLQTWEYFRDGPKRAIKGWFVDFKEAIHQPRLKPKFFWPFRWMHELRYLRFILIVMLAIALNLVPVAIDLVSFYFAIFTFDPVTYYKFIYMFIFDLWPILSRIPLIVYLVIAYVIFWKIRWKAGIQALRHQMNYVVGWIKHGLGMISIIVGNPNTGKTQTSAYLSLLTGMMFRDITLEMIDDIRHRFPDFPWRRLERLVEIAVTVRGDDRVRNLVSCEGLIDSRKGLTGKGTKLFRTFGYDATKYRTDYYDELVNENIWDALKDYAKLYYMYIFPKSNAVANFRIRESGVMFDDGEFPLWDFDFITRDNRLKEIFSRYSNILDLDSLRPGKKVVPNNPLAEVIDMGVISVDELGKERPNQPEMRRLNKYFNAQVANPENDFFNYKLKMLRHAATVRHQMMVRFYGNEQGYESIPEDLRRLGQIIHLVEEDAEWKLAMPLTWIIPWILERIVSSFKRFDIEYRSKRSDETLFHYAFKHLSSWAYSKLKKIHNQMDFKVNMAEVTDGRVERAPRIQKIFLPKKIVHGDLYNTDTNREFFKERQRKSKFGLIDLEAFGEHPATLKQILKTHGYFARWFSDPTVVAKASEAEPTKGERPPDDDGMVI